MIKLMYLICWSMSPVPTDCSVQEAMKAKTMDECIEAAKNMKGIGPAWCDSGREEKTVDSWLKATEPKADII